MLDLPALIATVTATRETLVAEEAAKRNRASGLTAMRPSIDYLTAEVLPRLEEAKAALAPAGVALTIDHQWAADIQARRPAVIVNARIAGDWPSSAATGRGDPVELEHGRDGLRVALRRQVENGFTTDPLPCAAGDEVDTALGRVVGSLLDRVTAGPRMQGSEVRGSGR